MATVSSARCLDWFGAVRKSDGEWNTRAGDRRLSLRSRKGNPGWEPWMGTLDGTLLK